MTNFLMILGGVAFLVGCFVVLFWWYIRKEATGEQRKKYRKIGIIGLCLMLSFFMIIGLLRISGNLGWANSSKQREEERKEKEAEREENQKFKDFYDAYQDAKDDYYN